MATYRTSKTEGQWLEVTLGREAGTSLVAQMVKNPPTVQESQVQFLGQEDPLEDGVASHSSILAWKIPWTEEPGGLQPGGRTESGMTE